MNDIKYVIINVICFFMLSFGFVMQGSFNRTSSHGSLSGTSSHGSSNGTPRYGSSSGLAAYDYCSADCCRAAAVCRETASQSGDFLASLAKNPSPFMERVINSINHGKTLPPYNHRKTLPPQDSINEKLDAMNREMQNLKEMLEKGSDFDLETVLRGACVIQKMQEEITEAMSKYADERPGKGSGFSH